MAQNCYFFIFIWHTKFVIAFHKIAFEEINACFWNINITSKLVSSYFIGTCLFDIDAIIWTNITSFCNPDVPQLWSTQISYDIRVVQYTVVSVNPKNRTYTQKQPKEVTYNNIIFLFCYNVDSAFSLILKFIPKIV